jgi:hypothetical protein
MANNLFVSYDLITPGQNYETVIAEIKQQGSWAKVHYSLFYLTTQKSAEQVANAVGAKMDRNDKLIVIDAKDASWIHLDEKVGAFLKQNW